MRVPFIMWAVVAIIALIPAAPIVAAPLLLASGHTFLAAAIYEVFRHLCHRFPNGLFTSKVTSSPSARAARASTSALP